ncbi:hypothetical protein MF271_19520 (plasmid) [Deinococcus sp. KNUC1210]|uniref:hypothetical protein n=1 Tax=Deinococcus sp. KNUC1210 TaxID=2917691 RepID=UPI001EEFD484|nr:hypothetical protein [Deinococcus sp. KNUC1210]ULH17382.1 hypothetical protein MF271_19520 [Deinococcus sp. KNUC1210]
MAAHWFSGWPGAVCLKCGAEDPAEAALGDPEVKFDLVTGSFTFPTPAAAAAYAVAAVCPVDDDPTIHPWLSKVLELGSDQPFSDGGPE